MKSDSSRVKLWQSGISEKQGMDKKNTIMRHKETEMCRGYIRSTEGTGVDDQ